MSKKLFFKVISSVMTIVILAFSIIGCSDNSKENSDSKETVSTKNTTQTDSCSYTQEQIEFLEECCEPALYRGMKSNLLSNEEMKFYATPEYTREFEGGCYSIYPVVKDGETLYYFFLFEDKFYLDLDNEYDSDNEWCELNKYYLLEGFKAKKLCSEKDFSGDKIIPHTTTLEEIKEIDPYLYFDNNSDYPSSSHKLIEGKNVTVDYKKINDKYVVNEIHISDDENNFIQKLLPEDKELITGSRSYTKSDKGKSEIKAKPAPEKSADNYSSEQIKYLDSCCTAIYPLDVQIDDTGEPINTATPIKYNDMKQKAQPKCIRKIESGSYTVYPVIVNGEAKYHYFFLYDNGGTLVEGFKARKLLSRQEFSDANINYHITTLEEMEKLDPYMYFDSQNQESYHMLTGGLCYKYTYKTIDGKNVVEDWDNWLDENEFVNKLLPEDKALID